MLEIQILASRWPRRKFCRRHHCCYCRSQYPIGLVILGGLNYVCAKILVISILAVAVDRWHLETSWDVCSIYESWQLSEVMCPYMSGALSTLQRKWLLGRFSALVNLTVYQLSFLHGMAPSWKGVKGKYLLSSNEFLFFQRVYSFTQHLQTSNLTCYAKYPAYIETASDKNRDHFSIF